jgi:N-acetylmuramoyl-L-alanine amidase
LKKYILLLAAILIIYLLSTLQPGLSQPVIPDETEITAFLNQHTFFVGSGASVREVYFQGEALVIDLSQEILPDGRFDEGVFTQLLADLDRAFEINNRFMTTFKIEGQTLDQWGETIPDFAEMVEPPVILESTRSGPLLGVRVALSPGHGRYWHESAFEWRWQRLLFNGIREDTLNPEIMRYVQFALRNLGATVIQLRELNPNAGIGVSGELKSHESSRQYAIAHKLPAFIYEGSDTNYNSDIRARPYMANYYGADLFISLHNNGWDGTLTGTETYYDYNNHPGSEMLAKDVHNKIINTIRTQYDPEWYSRGVKAAYDAYGEINYAQMPAILIELAFMDTTYPDNAYLHDETFKILAAKAIVGGICDYWEVSCPDISVVPPELNNHFFLPMIIK